MSKFEPSGSLKNANIVLEHRMDVIPRISNEIFLDLKCMFVIIGNLVGWLCGTKLEPTIKIIIKF